jgi:formate dehydrogenase subunit gamma
MTQSAQRTTGTPERVLRHKLVDRIYHWVMAITVLTLLFTALVPLTREMLSTGAWPTRAVAFGETILFGLPIDWLTVHWVAGFVLIFVIIYHIIRASIWLSFKSMLVGPSDAVATVKAATWMMGKEGAQPVKPGKYPLAQKLYHHGIAFMMIVLCVTGFLMIRKIIIPPFINQWWVTGPVGTAIEWVNGLGYFQIPNWVTLYWKRDPYWFGQAASAEVWGWIYVLHGAGALFALSLIMLHIYFGIRPDKFWISRSMFVGWIYGRDYREKFDQKRWKAPSVGGAPQPAAGDD